MESKIYIYGHPILREKCINLEKNKAEEVIAKMRHALNLAENGVGIAAPQVGEPYRAFIGPNDDVFINFEVLEMKGSEHRNREGCLSIPGIYGYVKRFQKIRIKYLDENWNWQEKLFKNFESVLCQHEIDHVNGILFIDHLSENDRDLIQPKLEDLYNGIVPNVSYPYQCREEVEEMMSDWVEIEQLRDFIPNIGGQISLDTRDFHVICKNKEELQNLYVFSSDCNYLSINQLIETLLELREKSGGKDKKWRMVHYKEGWFKYARIHRTELGFLICDDDHKPVNLNDLIFGI